MPGSTTTKEKPFYLNDLFHAYICDFPSLSGFYEYDYRSLQGFKQRIKDIKKDHRHERRGLLVEILQKTNRSLDCPEKTLTNIERLGSRDVFTVTAGQQPGLFTGPLYTVYKAMTAIRLSTWLKEHLKVEVIPVFWNASDDSFRQDVNDIAVYDSSGDISHISLDIPTDSKESRISNVMVKKDVILDTAGRLFDVMGQTAFSGSSMDFIERALNDEKEIYLNYFFSRLILNLFKESGLVIIDPVQLDLKSRSLELVLRDLQISETARKKTEKAGSRLKDLGFHSQLDLKRDTLDFFVDIDGKRRRVERSGECFNLYRKRYTKEQLARLVSDSIADLSLNVILRPVFQDTFLPNIATICGPGEVSYFAQLKDVYRLFGSRQPIIYPRFLATIIEDKVEKSLKRQGLDPGMLGPDKEKEIKAALRESSEFDITKTIRDLRQKLIKDLKDSEKGISDFLKEEKSPFDRINRNLAKELDVLEKKIISSLKKKNKIMSSDFDKIYKNIFPEDSLQERTINFFYFLNRYGTGIIEQIEGLIKVFDFHHKFIEV